MILAGAPDYGATSYYTFGVKLPEEPKRGDLVTISIAEGACIDIYGNENAETVVKDLLYSYDYNLEDILGEYQNAGTSGYGAAYQQLQILPGSPSQEHL